MFSYTTHTHIYIRTYLHMYVRMKNPHTRIYIYINVSKPKVLRQPKHDTGNGGTLQVWRPLARCHWHYWGHCGIGRVQNSVISSQLAQVMEYTEIDPATEGFNKAQWKRSVACCARFWFFLVSCLLFYLIAFLLRLAFALGWTILGCRPIKSQICDL